MTFLAVGALKCNPPLRPALSYGVLRIFGRYTESMQTKTEKRRFPRVCSTHLVYLEQRDDTGETVLQTQGRSIDLSVSGMLIECHRPHALTGPIDVTLSADEGLVECTGYSLRCERLTESRWTIAVELRDTPRIYLRQLSMIFADAA